jgi:tripartite-type tricarboxylate transporter receptor subunit TctC
VISRRLLLGLAASGLVLRRANAAESWPAKPIRIVVPFVAGGSIDIVSRIIAQHLTERLGQQVIVDNRPGAGGNLGTDMVAKSAPDGYTLVMASAGTLTINPGLYREMPFDAARDLAPVSLAGSAVNILVVNPRLPVQSVADLVRLAKEQPGKLDYGSVGNGTTNHLCGEMLKTMAAVDMVHIPYKAATQAVADLIAGELALMFINLPLALPQIQAGKLRALAVTGAQRSSAVPDVPTMIEAGLPGYVVESWNALLAPAGTPPEIIGRLSHEIGAIVSAPEVASFYRKQGAEPVTSTPAELTTLIADDTRKWAALIESSGARID